MKLLISVFLLLGIRSVTVYAAPADPVTTKPAPVAACPPSTILDASKCTCLSSALFMTCTGVDDTFITNFKPERFYMIDTLIIIDSPKLPKLDEKFHNNPEHKGLTAKKVIFTINSDATVDSHNLNSLLAVATDAIKIKSTVDKPLVFDTPNFPSSLKTIVLDNVKITNYDKVNAEKLTSLDRLQLNKVSIQLKDPDNHIVLNGQLMPKLTHIEITNCESLTGSFTYIPPKECPGKEIVLNLQNNPNLKDLNLFEIFEKSKCKYFIDLSGSKLNSEFLINNVIKIKPLTKVDQLYIVLRDVELNCNQCVYDWWSTRKQYVHSVVCQNEKNKFLDHIDKSKMNLKVNQADCKSDLPT